jgi:hypothetical protein
MTHVDKIPPELVLINPRHIPVVLRKKGSRLLAEHKRAVLDSGNTHASKQIEAGPLYMRQ